MIDEWDLHSLLLKRAIHTRIGPRQLVTNTSGVSGFTGIRLRNALKSRPHSGGWLRIRTASVDWICASEHQKKDMKNMKDVKNMKKSLYCAIPWQAGSDSPPWPAASPLLAGLFTHPVEARCLHC